MSLFSDELLGGVKSYFFYTFLAFDRSPRHKGRGGFGVMFDGVVVHFASGPAVGVAFFWSQHCVCDPLFRANQELLDREARKVSKAKPASRWVLDLLQM